MAREYKYKPLTEPDSIRLIELQPSSDPVAAIQCSLVHTRLSSEDIRDLFTHYTALSYVWGCSDKVETIWVDQAALKITASLSAALHDLRDTRNSFFLWADGICINQNDDDEKGFQVRLMGRIYEEATNTIIYLGPAGAESHECQYLRTVKQGHLASNRQLLSILSKVWFTRVWVFQELVFAANPWVQCGKARARWPTVYKTLLGVDTGLLDEDRKQSHKVITQMHQAWDNQQSSPKVTKLQDKHVPLQIGGAIVGNSMLELVKARRGLGVTDPRDMIFAHVGFALDSGHENLKVDYSKTTQEVYVDFALFVIEKHGWGTLLENVEFPESQPRLNGLPEWVPDWTVPFSTHLFPKRNASVQIDMVLSDPKTVYISRFDTIESVSLELQLGQLPPEIYQDFESWLSVLDIESSESYIHGTKEDLVKLSRQLSETYQIWKTAVGEEIFQPLRRHFRSSDVSLSPDKSGSCTRHRHCHTLEYSVELFLALAFRTDPKVDFLKGRALALTKNKQLALVPVASQEGDVIVPLPFGKGKLFRGPYKTFVFRPLGPLFYEDDKNNTDRRQLPKMKCGFVGGCFRPAMNGSLLADRTNEFIVLL
ncbi:HET domain containing protein [Hyaloscypha variabilis]